MRKKSQFIYWIILTILLSSCAGKSSFTASEAGGTKSEDKIELTISAAASLKDALTEIKSRYEQEQNVVLRFNFGSSGALKRQIEHGAPVDLFFSAAEDQFDQLVDKGLVVKSDGVDLLGNEIVLITPKKAASEIAGFKDLAKSNVRKVAIGTPSSVPAGQYAKQVLTHERLWDRIEDKLVFASDVRQVLAWVETGNVDSGIVYKTDAMVSNRVQVVATAEKGTHSPVVYPVGIVKNSRQRQAAEAFYQYIQGKEAASVFRKYGFQPIRHAAGEDNVQ